MPDSNDMLTSLLIAVVIVLAAMIICRMRKPEGYSTGAIWSGLPQTTQRLTGNPIFDTNPIPNNILNPESSIWSSPNMINFKSAIGRIQSEEKRRPKYFANEELFTGGLTEGYRPGDWNVNGYTAMQMMNNLKKKPTESFAEAPSVNVFLGQTRGLEDEPRRDPTRLADIPVEGYLPGYAAETQTDLGQLAGLEDERYYISENFVPGYSNPYSPSFVRDEENFSVSANLAGKRKIEGIGSCRSRLRQPERFIPGFAAQTGQSFNKLMNLEDSNYYLGEQWFPPAYYSNPLYMRQYAAQFNKKPEIIEGFIPAMAASYGQQLNKLMNEEDQNSYVGENWVNPQYYTNPLYMQNWERQFNPPKEQLFTESSIETPIRSTPIGVPPGVSAVSNEIDIPLSLTEIRGNTTGETAKLHG